MESKERSLIIADDSYLLGADDSPGVANHSALASAETERLDHEIGEYTVDFPFMQYLQNVEDLRQRLKSAAMKQTCRIVQEVIEQIKIPGVEHGLV